MPHKSDSCWTDQIRLKILENFSCTTAVAELVFQPLCTHPCADFQTSLIYVHLSPKFSHTNRVTDYSVIPVKICSGQHVTVNCDSHPIHCVVWHHICWLQLWISVSISNTINRINKFIISACLLALILAKIKRENIYWSCAMSKSVSDIDFMGVKEMTFFSWHCLGVVRCG